MSELIDRIADLDKISGEVKEVLTLIGQINTAITDVKDTVKNGVLGGARTAKDFDDLKNGAKSLNDEFAKGDVLMKRWEIEVANLKDKTKQLTDTEKQANIEIAKARLELQAAQKATKQAAMAEIELSASTKDVAQNYYSFKKELTATEKAFKSLTIEEQKSAKGRDLMNKYTELQGYINKTDEAFGHYQHNVGNYSSMLDGLTPKLGGFAGKLFDIAKSAKENEQKFKDMSDGTKMGIQGMAGAPAGLAKIVAGFKGVAQIIGVVGKAILANPIGVVVAALVGIFALLKSAISSNGQATEKLGQVFAPFKAMLGALMQVLGKLVSTFLDGVLAMIEFGNAVMSLIPGLDKVAEKNRTAIALEREKQKLIREGILDKAFDAKEELRLAELRKKIMEKDKYSAEERLAFAREVDAAEKKMAYDDADRANRNLKNFLRNMAQKKKSLKDYTIDELKELADLQAAKYQEEQKYFDKTKKLAGREAALIEEINADKKASDEKFIAARRRLIDSGFAILKDGLEKELAINAETYKRQIEDLQRNGELTIKLRDNILKAQKQSEEKIRKDYEVKNLNDSIKADELVLENMKRAGDNTLTFEKELLKKKMDAEILAGGDKLEIQTKYQYLQTDLETQNAEKRAELFAKNLNKEVQILKDGYSKKEKELKEQYSRGEIDKEKYEKRLKEIQDKAAYEANAKTIELLKKQLSISELSADKRAELSKQISDLEIANENAVLDATIEANEKKLESDKAIAAKREEIARGLVDATAELFGSIADFQTQKAEQRIAELEKEQEKIDETFNKDQENLNNAIMSDETRAQKQQELNDQKAASEKALQQKIIAEKIKVAKWEKANSIIQAIISTAMSVLNSSKLGFPLAIPFIALAAATGAVNIATIASQPLPAYEHGTDNHPGGWSLWGEKRPEVAVEPTGKTFIATKPTVTNFDAGTKIYDSVQAYENAIGKQAIKELTFDYDKFGEKMPQNNIILDSRGLWGIVTKQNDRRNFINRRYSR